MRFASSTLRNRVGGTINNMDGEIRINAGRFENYDDALVDNSGLLDLRWPALLLNVTGGRIMNRDGAGMLLRSRVTSV